MAGDLGWLIVVAAAECVLAVLGLQRVDVDRAVGGLSGDKLVQRIPGNTLDVMAVLGNLSYKDTCAGLAS